RPPSAATSDEPANFQLIRVAAHRDATGAAPARHRESGAVLVPVATKKKRISAGKMPRDPEVSSRGHLTPCAGATQRLLSFSQSVRASMASAHAIHTTKTSASTIRVSPVLSAWAPTNRVWAPSLRCAYGRRRGFPACWRMPKFCFLRTARPLRRYVGRSRPDAYSHRPAAELSAHQFAHGAIEPVQRERVH